MSIFGSDKKDSTHPDKITVIAELRAKSGHEKEVRVALEATALAARKEAGCMSYVLHESKYYTGDLFTYEEWESEAMLEKHLEGAKAALNALKGLLREDLRITVLKTLV